MDQKMEMTFYLKQGLVLNAKKLALDLKNLHLGKLGDDQSAVFRCADRWRTNKPHFTIMLRD